MFNRKAEFKQLPQEKPTQLQDERILFYGQDDAERINERIISTLVNLTKPQLNNAISKGIEKYATPRNRDVLMGGNLALGSRLFAANSRVKDLKSYENPINRLAEVLNNCKNSDYLSMKRHILTELTGIEIYSESYEYNMFDQYMPFHLFKNEKDDLSEKFVAEFTKALELRLPPAKPLDIQAKDKIERVSNDMFTL